MLIEITIIIDHTNYVTSKIFWQLVINLKDARTVIHYKEMLLGKSVPYS